MQKFKDGYNNNLVASTYGSGIFSYVTPQGSRYCLRDSDKKSYLRGKQEWRNHGKKEKTEDK